MAIIRTKKIGLVLELSVTRHTLTHTLWSGATWLRRGLRNPGCMPRRRIPRKYSCKPYSCQRRQLRFSCLKTSL